MKQLLEQIYNHKKKTITYYNGVNKRLLAIIYGGLSKNKSIKQIHKEIRNIYDYSNIRDKDILNYCYKLTKKCNKNIKKAQVNKISDINISLIVLKTFQKEKSYQVLTQFSYKKAQELETKQKQKIIKHELSSNHVFYLSSKHDDCALDHLHAQGRLYYNQNWKTFVSKDNQELRDRIERFIYFKRLETFQSIVKAPTWFITRPNCRHYFKKVSTDEVFDNSIEALINKHNMTSTFGYKEMKNIKHSTKKDWYTHQNVENIIEKYKDRLVYHKMLYKQNPNDFLQDLINKDMFLITKWKRYLKKIDK